LETNQYKVKVRDFYKLAILKAKLFCILVYLTVFHSTLSAQIFEDVQILDMPGVSISIKKVLKNNNATFVYGQYNAPLQIGAFDLDHVGSVDLFLIKMVAGEAEWVFFGGSNGSDSAVDIHLDNNEDIIIGGEFWLEAQFGDITLVTEGTTKALFVLKLNQNGEVIAEHTINGTGAKNMRGISLIEEDIYVSGSFSDTLFLPSTVAVALSDQDIFLLKLDQVAGEGWIQNYGVEGDSDTSDFSWDEVNQQFVVTGEYLGRIAVADDTIQTNTFDQDVFVAAFSILGEGLWLEKAGGQFEDFNLAHSLDDEGNIYLTGFYRGIIGFSDGSEINTGGQFNSDAYLIKYNSTGEKVWARTLGSMQGRETGTNLAYADERIFLTGFYDFAFTIDDLSLPESEYLFNGLVAVFDTEGNLDRGIPLICDNTVVPNGVIPDEECTFVYGDFVGTLVLDQPYNVENFSAFQVCIRDLILSSTNIMEEQSIQVYPNPVAELLNINLERDAQRVTLFDVRGVLMYQSNEKRLAHTIDCSRLVSGIYFWRTESGAAGKIIKK